MKEKRLYVVFSATPLKMGTMIRTVTGERYNHISVSFDHKLRKMYSYARYYKKAPLYGGFVCEKPSRYKNNDKTADVFVCALPITAQQCLDIKKRLRLMSRNPKQYIYNFYSAALAPFSRRVFVPNCFTCVEFASHIISMVCPLVKADRFYSVEQLRRILSPYLVYLGPFPDIEQYNLDSEYHKHIPLYDVCRLSLRSEVDLFDAFFTSKVLK